MNTLTTTDTPKTMTSREIAALTGKRHNNVTADIRNLCEALDVDALKFQYIYKDAGGRKQTEYVLPKRETLILVSGYSATMRAKIIDRWRIRPKGHTETTGHPTHYPATPDAFQGTLRPFWTPSRIAYAEPQALHGACRWKR